MSNEVVSVTFDDGIAVIVIDNPPVNTITAAVRAGLSDALERIRQKPDTKAVVIRCAGSTFLSGADINEFDGPPREEEYRRLFNAYEQLDVPVVAALHGTVLGGGLEFSLACHYR
ncbi:MAG: enoyl-CoA hydratase/isomerase family protein, partial [Gammaproteobacteria bacterium]